MMNKFIWSITFKEKVNLKNLKFKYLEILSDEWICTYFLFWETKEENSDNLIKIFEKLWELISYDISFDNEDNIALLNDDLSKWIYEQVSFEWPEILFENILDRFSDVYEVISVREAEISTKYNNRIIRVDFVY